MRWRIEELLVSPECAQPYEDVMAEDGNWVRERRPRILRLEPENRDGPSGFRSSLHAAIRAPKKYVPHRLEHVGAHVEIREGKRYFSRPRRTRPWCRTHSASLSLRWEGFDTSLATSSSS